MRKALVAVVILIGLMIVGRFLFFGSVTEPRTLYFDENLQPISPEESEGSIYDEINNEFFPGVHSGEREFTYEEIRKLTPQQLDAIAVLRIPVYKTHSKGTIPFPYSQGGVINPSGMRAGACLNDYFYGIYLTLELQWGDSTTERCAPGGDLKVIEVSGEELQTWRARYQVGYTPEENESVLDDLGL